MPSPHAAVLDTRRSPHATLHPAPVDAWRLDDAFWSRRLERNRVVTIPAQWELLERTGPLPTLIEWDNDVPPFDTLCAQAERAQGYLSVEA